jgi:hypothetical protein
MRKLIPAFQICLGMLFLLLLAGCEEGDMADPKRVSLSFVKGVRNVAQGEGLPDAAEYDGGPGFHPVAYATRWREHKDWNVYSSLLHYPSDWAALEIEDLELVVTEVSELLDSGEKYGPYSGNKYFDLKIAVRTVTIRSARTGDVIAEKRFIGTMDPSWVTKSDSKYVTQNVAKKALVAWVRQYVHTSPQ